MGKKLNRKRTKKDRALRGLWRHLIAIEREMAAGFTYPHEPPQRERLQVDLARRGYPAGMLDDDLDKYCGLSP